MARILAYEDAHDRIYYVVVRSDGKSEGRKEFYSYAEAEAYQNYLQSIEDRERALAQNQQIIANQERLIRSQEQQRIRPNVTRQVLDPQYEEWLRFKKATDPAFIAWKAEEEKKKKAKEDEERIKMAQRKKEEDMSYLKRRLKDVAYIENRINSELKVYQHVSALYREALSISTSSSMVISYYSDNEYSDTFKIPGHVLIESYDSENKIKSSHERVLVSMKSIPDVASYIDDLRNFASQCNRGIFDDRIKTLSSFENALFCFYMYFGKSLSKIAEGYKSLYSTYWLDGYFSARKPHGLFTKQKIRSAFNEYKRNNLSKYKSLIEINRRFQELIKSTGLYIAY